MENKCRVYTDNGDGEYPLFFCTAEDSRKCRFYVSEDYRLSVCKYEGGTAGNPCRNISAQVDAIEGSIAVFRRWMNRNCKGSDL